MQGIERESPYFCDRLPVEPTKISVCGRKAKRGGDRATATERKGMRVRDGARVRVRVRDGARERLRVGGNESETVVSVF